MTAYREPRHKEKPMIAFLVDLENRSGTAAEVAEAIAERGINVIGGAGMAVSGIGSAGMLAVATNDEAGTRRVLLGRGWKFREIEVVPFAAADTPGSLAQACRDLGDADINIEAFFPMVSGSERNTIAFATDDPAQARSILSKTAKARTGGQ
jgi:hypothetical protein